VRFVIFPDVKSLNMGCRMHLINLLVVSYFLVISTVASAEKLNYSYVEAGYSIANYDGDTDWLVDDIDGFVIQASVELNKIFYIEAGYSQRDGDEPNEKALRILETFGGGIIKSSNNIDAEHEDYFFALGARNRISDNISIHAELSYFDSTIEADMLSVIVPGPSEGNIQPLSVLAVSNSTVRYERSGIGTNIGVRGSVTQNFELSADIHYLDVDDDDLDPTLLSIGALYRFTDTVGLTLSLGVNDYSETNYGASVRFMF
jgi:hypothetical protein